MALSELQIRHAKPQAKPYKMSDGGGLQLWISPDGAKRWRLAYRFGGKQKALAIGVYPAVGAKQARDEREKAKALLAAGQDPSAVRKLTKASAISAAANTFDAVADELLAKKSREGKAERTSSKIEWLLSLARPDLGPRPIAQITAAEVLRVLKIVEARGKLETAKRLRATIGQVFRLAIATGRAENDPTGALRGALAAPVVRHRAAIIDPKGFGALLRAIDGYEGAPETKAALLLSALTFCRPGEIRSAEWVEIDLQNAVWSIPAEKMKMRRPHRVPLSKEAVAVLDSIKLITGNYRFVFPSARSHKRCMSENTITGALRRLGFTKDEMTAHGFRSAASSILNESGLWNADAIERQLAHVDNDSVRRAYARADFWDERVRMMQWWADHCRIMRKRSMD
jgi:integrase